MKIIAQSHVVPKANYVHLAYTSANNDAAGLGLFFAFVLSIVLLLGYLLNQIRKPKG